MKVSKGNLVSGNHRWEQLKEEHGDSLELQRLEEPLDDFLMVFGTGEFTGYLLREVDWDEEKEKAANIAANSEKLKGEFTNAVASILDDISDSGSRVPKVLFDNLRLNELKLDFAPPEIDFDASPVNEFDFDDDYKDDFDDSELEVDHTAKEKVEKDTVEMALIKIRCPMEKRSEIIELVTNALVNENDIKIS